MRRGNGHAGGLPRSRMRWFTGRFLTARDLTDEQEYHLGRHRLHNRLLHGWGTVCGLRVRPDDRPECEREYVRVEPGLALDCLGREVILARAERVRWPIDPHRTAAEDAVGILCVRYRECPADPMPTVVGDCSASHRSEPGRIVEGCEFEVHVPTGDPDDPWSDLLRTRTDPDCASPAPPDRGCLDPDCELGDCVPIALLSRVGDGPIRVDVDQHGDARTVRRSLPPPAAQLTHITRASWAHGADVPVEDLIAAGGELRVRFDRPIADGDEIRTGVNAFTFVVEVEDSTGSRERLAADPNHPPRLDDGCEAVFTIDPDALRVSRRHGGRPSIVGDAVFVTVYGDLIHDRNGLPVDADFFGSFPTGDGIKGGVFRSWFVVSDGYEQPEEYR